MSQGLDVKHINPFLQSSITIFQTAARISLSVGKPCVANLDFHEHIFALQVGLTGDLKGQVLLVMHNESAKKIASNMMFGIPVSELDEMACSALSELSNMIMGNTATLFSTMNIHIDITPPMTLIGSQIKLQSDASALKIPLCENGNELLSLYICVLRN